MKVLFLGCLFNLNEEEMLMTKSKVGLSGAVNTFQWSLIKGLDKNLLNPVDIINVLPVGTFPKYFREVVLPTKSWTHSKEAKNLEVGSLNLPFVKQLERSIACKKAVNNWLKINGEENKSIIVYTPYLPFLYAISKVPRNIKVTLIVTDIPEFYDLTISSNFIRRFLRTLNNRLVYALLKRIDKFVLLTDEMKGPLKVGERSYTVLEGLIDPDIDNYCGNNKMGIDKKIILYTGTLNIKYGIMNLVKAFTLIDNRSYELWICGSGEAEKEIIRASDTDQRIKYFGYISKEETHKLQQNATVLVNPRSNEGEYTKYSFPSKTMEYMLSGKPVLMYKLDGIPQEYAPYLYYIKGNNPEDIAERIMEVCEKPQRELKEFGESARQFVLEYKNCFTQAKKIVELIFNEG